MVKDLNFKDLWINSINGEIASKLAIIARNKSLRRSDLLKQELSKIIESEKDKIDFEKKKSKNVRLVINQINVNTINKLTAIATNHGIEVDEYLKLKFAEIANNATPYELRNTDLEKE